MTNEILYSFRRCPYAMRARWAILLCQKQVKLREVKLSNKPSELIKAGEIITISDKYIDRSKAYAQEIIEKANTEKDSF